jgi:hypothetical protein
MLEAEQLEKCVEYRGCRVLLRTVVSPDDPGRFIAAWRVSRDGELKYQGRALESYGSAEDALAAGERSMPIDVDRLFQDGRITLESGG